MGFCKLLMNLCRSPVLKLGKFTAGHRSASKPRCKVGEVVESEL